MTPLLTAQKGKSETDTLPNRQTDKDKEHHHFNRKSNLTIQESFAPFSKREELTTKGKEYQSNCSRYICRYFVEEN